MDSNALAICKALTTTMTASGMAEILLEPSIEQRLNGLLFEPNEKAASVRLETPLGIFTVTVEDES